MRTICHGRGALVAAMLVAAVAAPAAAKGKGAAVSLDYTQAPLADVLRVLADVGRINVVFVDAPVVKVDVKYDKAPWDDVLREVVAQAKLAYVMEGNVAIVGPQAAIDARKAEKKKKATGPVVDIELVGASAKDAATLLAIASGTAFDLDGGGDASLRLRRVPLSAAKELIALHAHATVVAAPAKRALARGKGACAAPTLPVADLEIVGIAAIGLKRWAMLGTKTSAETFVIAPSDCLGIERTKIKTIGAAFVELDGNTILKLSPAPP